MKARSKRKAPQPRVPSHPDPEIAVALDRMFAEEEDRDRMILGMYHRAGAKPRRGRPPTTAKEPSEVFAKVEGRPWNQLSTKQRELTLRIGVDETRGRSQAEVARIVSAVLQAKKLKHPLTEAPAHGKQSAYEVAGLQLGMAPEAVAAVWKRNQRQVRKAKTHRI